MTPMLVSSVAFAVIFAGALCGMVLRRALPENHLSEDSKDMVKLGMALVGTMSALVLGLLIASAKGSYDTQNAELTEMSAKIVLLDRMLAHYGPEANDARVLLRATVEHLTDRLWERRDSREVALDSVTTRSEALYEMVQGLSPKDDKQRLIQAQALNTELALGQTRWLMFEQAATPIPKALVGIMVFWLTVIFISWGIFAPRNATVIATLFVTAASVSSAIFMILEMYTPYSGLIHISSDPLRSALAHLGQ
jgi:hypothetical protein